MNWELITVCEGDIMVSFYDDYEEAYVEMFAEWEDSQSGEFEEMVHCADVTPYIAYVTYTKEENRYWRIVDLEHKDEESDLDCNG